MIAAITESNRDWRGYLNQILYGVDLRAPVGDDVVERVATAMLDRLVFADPPEVYYHAMTTALDSNELLSSDEDQDEVATRDFLFRLVGALDERRPWPVPPFDRMDNPWNEFRDAPLIGRIAQRKRTVENRLRKEFRVPVGDDNGTRFLILRLASGHIVALSASKPFVSPNVEIRSFDNPNDTLRNFEGLTGIEVSS